MKSTYIGIGVVVIIGILFFLFSNKSASQVAQVPGGTSEIEKQATTVVSTTTETTKPTTNNTPKTMTTASGLKIEDEVVGTGAEAKAGDNVTVQYVGSLTNGTVFDASRSHGDQGFTFMLGAGQVIKGWDMGVAGMKVGGKRKLTIPADLAYGNQAVGGVIPANSTLIFEVELIKTGK